MPPEPSPWDRKELFRDRKNERSEPPFGSGSRWRDSSTTSSSSHYVPLHRDFSRWGSDFRRAPGHGKQGSWHLFHEEAGHGYVPFRSNDRVIEDGNYRASFPRVDWRHGRNNRESRVSSSQRDWRSCWDGTSGPTNGPGRLCGMNNDHRSVVGRPAHFSSPYSEPARVDQLCLKDKNDDKVSNIDSLSPTQQCEKESPMEATAWKSMKWLRTGSLSSRGSGFSHSSSSKSLGAVDSEETKAEVMPKDPAFQLSSGDAAACPTSAIPSEEMTPRKKPRLGWGEGLAKYEKKKADTPDMNLNKDGNTGSSNSTEPLHSLSPIMVDRSPRVMGITDCASPTTPSSVACSSSQGVEEKSAGRAANVDNYASNISSSPGIGSRCHIERFPFNLEKLDNSLIDNLGCLLTEMFQSDDPGSVDSSFVRSTAINKVLVWKGDVLKSLEMTESEIERLEKELKMFKSESGAGNTLSKDQDAASSRVPQPAHLQIDSIAGGMLEKKAVLHHNSEGHADVVDEDVDSPGTATSKLSEALTLVNANPSVGMEINNDCFHDMVANQSFHTVTSINKVPNCSDDHKLVQVEKNVLVPGWPDLDAEDMNVLCTNILVANKESAKKASEVFYKLLPNDANYGDISRMSDVLSPLDDPRVRRKAAVRWRSLKFKERVLALKFRALHYVWKEDLHEVSIRKNRAKPQKKHELSLRVKNGGCQKHRSLLRSQYFQPGDVSNVLSPEILSFLSRLLSNPKLKLHRDELKMPALILDEKEKAVSRFISGNGLVEDPWAVEKERCMINPWTPEEKRIFMDKLAIYGKDFRRIASFLGHKTTADCVEFYYKNHKSDYFDKPKKLLDGAKQQKSLTNTYMMAPMSVAARADRNSANKQMSFGRISLRGCSNSRSSRHNDILIERSSSVDLPEKETFAADVLAGICGSVSSEAISSCITGSVDPKEKSRDLKWRRPKISMKQPPISDGMQNPDDNGDDSRSDESSAEMEPSSQWTDEERSAFVQAVSSYGKDFKIISRCVRTKSADQCRVFFSKARKRLGLQSLHPSSGNSGTSFSEDSNGGGGDMEDGCILRTSSVICNDEKSVTKVDVHFQVSCVDVGEDVSDTSGFVKRTELNGCEEPRAGPSYLKEGVETMDSNACQIQCKPLVVSLNGSKARSESSTVSENELVQLAEDSLKVTADLEEKTIPAAVGKVSFLPAELSILPLCSSTTDRSQNTLRGQDPWSRGTNLNKRRGEGPDMCTDDKCGTSQEMDARFGARESVTDFSPAGLHHVPIQLDSMENPLLPRGNSPVIVRREPTVSAFSRVFKKFNKETSPICNLEDERVQIPAEILNHNRHIPTQLQVNYDESSWIPPIEKEMDGSTRNGKLTNAQSTSKSDKCIISTREAQDFSLRGCSSLTSTPVWYQREQKSGHPRTHSRSLSDSEKPSRNHNVRLFGKILTAHEHDDKINDDPRLYGRPSKKLAGQHDTKGNMGFLKFDDVNEHGLENVPIASYSFWDGNKIQTGFGALPDSAALLAKYPAAFGNNPASSSKPQQQGIAKSNGRTFSPKEINGVVEYPSHRDCNGVSKVPPFINDVKHHHEIQPETHRRNVLEKISSLPQFGGQVVATSVIGAGVEVPISDPVAAIKMHYARTRQYSSKNGNLLREETMGGTRDIGR